MLRDNQSIARRQKYPVKEDLQSGEIAGSGVKALYRHTTDFNPTVV